MREIVGANNAVRDQRIDLFWFITELGQHNPAMLAQRRRPQP